MISKGSLSYIGTEPAFGPPVYDEYGRVYLWRTFKKGAIWGGSLSFILTTQFAFFQHLMSPGKRATRDLVAIPFIWASVGAFAFGMYEIFVNP